MLISNLEILSELRQEETDVAYNESAEVDSVEAEIQREEQVAKVRQHRRADVEKWSAAAEAELPILGAKEAELLASRLADIRSSAMDDERDRFEPRIRELQNEASKWEKRVVKYWDKMKVDERASADEKIHDGLLIARKAAAKITE